MAELFRYHFMKYIQFEVKIEESRKKKREKSGERLIKQSRESTRTGGGKKKGEKQIRNFKDKGNFNRCKV